MSADKPLDPEAIRLENYDEADPRKSTGVPGLVAARVLAIASLDCVPTHVEPPLARSSYGKEIYR
jgi:hypothetical protein